MTDRVRAVVAGAGITGLVAARELALAGADVTVLEPGRIGGKVGRSPFDGGLLDEAADAFLARVPEGVALCRDLGLEDDLVSPAERRAYVWSRGALRPLPERHVLGVPTDLEALAATGLVSPAGVDEVRRRDLERPLVAPDGDVTIGAFLRDRLGDEVVDRLVDPLVGGINAGAVDRLSLAAVVPQLDAAARSGAPSLVEACRRQRAAAADPEAPVFFAPAGGMGALVEALEADLRTRGVHFVAAAATSLVDVTPGWSVADAMGTRHPADVAVLTTPAGVSGELLAPHAPGSSAVLGDVEHASVALVALAVDPARLGRPLDGSGFLVPRLEGRTVTACSWTSSKWPHLHGDGTVWLRASVGRAGEDTVVHLPDDELLTMVLDDLRELMALDGPALDTRVSRWWQSFPQYAPGHLAAADAVDDGLPRGVAVAGAALRGLGVPACIRQGAAAARRLLADVGEAS